MSKKPFQRKDRFYFKAKKDGYPARSAYKIIEFHDRFKIFKQGNTIIDIGCAPGGWLKVGQEKLNGKGLLIGIDLLPLNFTVNETTLFVQGDFTEEENKEWIRSKIQNGADWVISDISPNISGVKFSDQYQSYELCHQAFTFSLEVLNPGGSFLCKVFPGAELEVLRKEMKKSFKKLVTVTPEATRKSSTEIYLIGLNLKTSANHKNI